MKADKTETTLYVFDIELSYRPEPQLHTHESHEFFLCRHGGGVQYADERRIEMCSGDVFFFPSSQRHIASGPADGQCHATVINLHQISFLSEIGQDFCARLVLDYLKKQAFQGCNRLPLTSSTRRHIAKTMQRMVQECHTRMPGYASVQYLEMQRMLLAILRDDHILPHLHHHFRKQSLDDRLEAVCRYIRFNYANHITVEQMARVACLSRSHLHAAFKEYTGKRLTEYINIQRVQAAAYQLEKKEQTIQEIALNCGFSNLSHFYHTFKRYFHQSPGSYA